MATNATRSRPCELQRTLGTVDEAKLPAGSKLQGDNGVEREYSCVCANIVAPLRAESARSARATASRVCFTNVSQCSLYRPNVSLSLSSGSPSSPDSRVEGVHTLISCFAWAWLTLCGSLHSISSREFWPGPMLERRVWDPRRQDEGSN